MATNKPGPYPLLCEKKGERGHSKKSPGEDINKKVVYRQRKKKKEVILTPIQKKAGKTRHQARLEPFIAVQEMK